MPDLIDRGEMLDIAEQQGHVTVDDLVNATTITLESLVKHGRWVEKYHIRKMYYSSDDIEHYKVQDGFCCGCCNKSSRIKTKYCPNCGAKMDLEADNET